MTGVKRTRKSFKVASRYLAAVDGQERPTQNRATSPTIPDNKNANPTSNPTTPKRNKHSLSTSLDDSLNSAKTPPHSCSKTTTTQTTIDSTPVSQASYRQGSSRTPTRDTGWTSRVRGFFPAAAVVSQQNTDGDDTDGSSLTDASQDNKKAAQEISELSSIGTNSRPSTPDLEIEEPNQEKFSDSMRLMEDNLREALIGKEGTRRSGSSKRPVKTDPNSRGCLSETGEQSGKSPNQQQRVKQIPTISQASWIKKKKAERTFVYKMGNYLGTTPVNQNETHEAYQVSECGAPTEIISNTLNTDKDFDTKSDAMGAPTEIMTNRETSRHENKVDQDENDLSEFQSGQVASVPQHQWCADDSLASSRRASPGFNGRGKSDIPSSDTVNSEGGQIYSERFAAIGRSKSNTPTSEIANSDSGQIYSERFSSLRTVGRAGNQTPTSDVVSSDAGQMYSGRITPTLSRHGQWVPKSDSSQISSGVFSGLESTPSVMLSPSNRSIGRLGRHVNTHKLVISPIMKRSEDRSITSSIGVEINADSGKKPSWKTHLNNSFSIDVHNIAEEPAAAQESLAEKPASNTVELSIVTPTPPESHLTRKPPLLPDFHQRPTSDASPGKDLHVVSNSPFLVHSSQNTSKQLNEADPSKSDSNPSPVSSGWTPTSISASAIEPEPLAMATPETIRVKGENKNASTNQKSNPFNTLNNVGKQKVSRWQNTPLFMASHAQIHRQEGISSLKKATESESGDIPRNLGHEIVQNEDVLETPHETCKPDVSSAPALTSGHFSVKDRIRAFSKTDNGAKESGTPEQGAKHSSRPLEPKLAPARNNESTITKKDDANVECEEAASIPREQAEVQVVGKGKLENAVVNMSSLKQTSNISAYIGSSFLTAATSSQMVSPPEEQRYAHVKRNPVVNASSLNQGGNCSAYVDDSFRTAATSSRMVSPPGDQHYEQTGSQPIDNVKSYSVPLKKAESSYGGYREHKAENTLRGNNDNNEASAGVRNIRSFFESQNQDGNINDEEDDQSLDVQSIRSIFEEGNQAPLEKESAAFKKTKSMFEAPQKEQPRSFSGNTGVKKIWARFESEKKRGQSVARTSSAPPSGNPKEKSRTEEHILSSGIEDEKKSKIEHGEETSEVNKPPVIVSPHRMSVLDRARLFSGAKDDERQMQSEKSKKQTNTYNTSQQRPSNSVKSIPAPKGSQNATRFPVSSATPNGSNEHQSHSESSAGTRVRVFSGGHEHVSVTDNTKDSTYVEDKSRGNYQEKEQSKRESLDMKQSSNVQKQKLVHVQGASQSTNNFSVKDRIKAFSVKPTAPASWQSDGTSGNTTEIPDSAKPTAPASRQSDGTSGNATELPDSMTEFTEPGAIGICPRTAEQTNIESASFAKVQVGNMLESPRKLRTKLAETERKHIEKPPPVKTPTKESIAASNAVRKNTLQISKSHPKLVSPCRSIGSGSRSDSDFDDGVTLELSIAEVSALTNPTCLQSKEEMTSSNSSQVSSEHTSRDERLARRSEASSSQMSEAAAPLIARMQFSRSSDHIASLASGSSSRRSNARSPLLFQRQSWDTTQITPTKVEKSSSFRLSERQQFESPRNEEKRQDSDFEEAFDAPLSKWNMFPSNDNSWFEWIPTEGDDFASLEGANAVLKDKGNQKDISPPSTKKRETRAIPRSVTPERWTPHSEEATLSNNKRRSHSPRAAGSFYQPSSNPSTPVSESKTSSIHHSYTTGTSTTTPVRSNTAPRKEAVTSPPTDGKDDSWSSTRTATMSRLRTLKAARRERTERKASRSKSADGQRREYDRSAAVLSTPTTNRGVYSSGSSPSKYGTHQNEKHPHKLRERLEDPQQQHRDIHIPMDDFSLSTKDSTRFGGQNFETCLELD